MNKLRFTIRKAIVPRALSLCFCVALTQTTFAAEAVDKSHAKASPDGRLLWYDAQLLVIEGQGWADTKADYDRLPARAEAFARPKVWSLSRDSSGICVRFVTDATTLHARWRLTSKSLSMVHMPATGVSGLDLYVRLEDGAWRWLSVGRPTELENEAQLVSGIPAGRREYRLYLPLYNGVSSVELGIPKDASITKAPPRPTERSKPIVFYGTSITHGGCASRPGMTHVAILGRRLDRPVINLGFSGNGHLDLPLAPLFAEIDAAVYVLDCVPNMDADMIRERAEPFVRKLRAARPNTPIVLVEDRTYPNAFLVTSRRRANQERRAAYRQAYNNLVNDGVTGLSYVPGDSLLGQDGEDTVDGSHPTDLGFFRQANTLERVLRPLVEKSVPAH